MKPAAAKIVGAVVQPSLGLQSSPAYAAVVEEVVEEEGGDDPGGFFVCETGAGSWS